MLRRLPLLGTATKETPVLSAVRVPLGPGSIGIADTSTGELAARFAVDLAIAFARLDTRVQLTVLGYQAEPVLGRGLVAELTAHGITPVQRALPSDGSLVDLTGVLATAACEDASLASGSAVGRQGSARSDGELARSDTPRVALFVGYPALGACRPALSLLLGADRSLQAWPELLRGVREELALSLAVARAGLAPLLATALIERGFLPRG